MATSRLQMEADDSVNLHITHSNLKSFSADVRFSPQVSTRLRHKNIITDFNCFYMY